MFTGIITQVSRVLALQHKQQGASLEIAASFVDLQVGESIAIDGTCLTVTASLEDKREVGSARLSFDISPETWQLTTLQSLQAGAQVNVERALCIGERLGGHFVTGHIDQVCSLASLRQEGEFLCMSFTGINKSSIQNVIKKGSIAVNGVSLTVNEVRREGEWGEFTVMLIPQTLAATNLGQLKIGDKVNIEFDMLVKVINNQLRCFL